MNIKKRLVKLENAVKMQTDKYVITRIIVETDVTISGAIRRDAGGEYASVSDEELIELSAINQLAERAK